MMDPAEFSREVRLKRGVVFLNHAATNPLSRCAARAMREIVQQAQEPMEGHLSEWIGIIEQARRQTARLLGTSPDEIAFVQNTSSGLSLIAHLIPFEPGDRILYDQEDFPSNRYIWESMACRKALPLDAVPFTLKPGEDPLAVFRRCDLSRVRVITLSLVSYHTGVRHNLDAISAFCLERGIFLCVDAIQAIGALQVDLATVPGVSFLACGGQKWLHGPLGSGFIFVRKQLIEALNIPMAGWASVDKAGQFRAEQVKWLDSASRYEAGLPDVAAIAGLGRNIELYNGIGMPRIAEEVLRRRAVIRSAIEKWPVKYLGPEAPEQASAILAFELDSRDKAEAIARALEDKKIIITRRDTYFRIAPHFHTQERHIHNVVEIFSHYLAGKHARIPRHRDASVPSGGSPGRAVIVGASGALGAAVAEVLAQRKYRLLLVARDTTALNGLVSRLRQVYGVDIETAAAELSDLGDVERLAAFLHSWHCDFFAYTAAAATAANATDQPQRDEQEAFAVNYFAPVRLARSIVPGMIARGRGRLLFMTTAGSRCATPLFSAYAASKAALWAWVESLSQELAATPVSCTIAVPPHMKSATQQKLARTALRHFKINGSETMSNPLRVAQELVDAALRGKAVSASLDTRIKHAINALYPQFMRRQTLARYTP